ncbi:glycoside hydrolase family 43 protein [Chitinophaga sp. sic0106]|uniref:glycoside hydrolase family 43 protein n=1 Tax=Chitinophaga sp. sic0106 TaxID=2854785 RepID=UPI001C447DAD|nr:glycoside hydrolase family 43 protein [Chitinophaga sp. sic0106]MBV7530193.1 glycoside hydrolase family 43 protein [Chitinophaga sp. sic0106]
MPKQLTYLLVGLLIILASCSQKAYLFTSFQEPATDGLRLLYSYNGYTWKDMDTVFLKPGVGTQKVMRDPSMVQGPDGTFYLVWTSSWRGDKGFGHATSKDLLHWSEQGLLPIMNETEAVNVWAPELFYDKESDDMKVVWAACIPGKFPKGQEEDSNNHRLYYTHTKDLRAFGRCELFFDPGYSVIDAVIVQQSKNKYVLVFKDNTRPERDLKVAHGSSPLGPWSNISAPFTDKLTEGPSVVKLKNRWLIYYDAYGKKTYEAVETRDFLTFQPPAHQIELPEGHKHGTIVPVKKKLVKDLLKQLGKP